jgi:hypothetical protein
MQRLSKKQSSIQPLQQTGAKKESSNVPPEQKTASDFGKQIAACLNKAEPNGEECKSIFGEMQENGIRALDLSHQRIGSKGIDCLTAALEDRHSFLNDHLKELNFSNAILGTVSPVLKLVEKVKGGNIESMNFSCTRISIFNGKTRKIDHAPFHASHFTCISHIVRECKSLRSLNLDGQHVLSALTAYSDGKPPPPPPMIELMRAAGEGFIVDMSFKNCNLGPSDLLAIRDVVTTRESTGEPGSGLQFIRVDENPRMVDEKSHSDVLNFILALDTNSSLQELHLPFQTLRAFRAERLDFDLPSNRTLKKLEPISSMPAVPQPLEPLWTRLRYNANPWPGESLEDQYRISPDAGAAILKELTDDQAKEVDRLMLTLPEGLRAPENYVFFAKQVLRQELDKQ